MLHRLTTLFLLTSMFAVAASSDRWLEELEAQLSSYVRTGDYWSAGAAAAGIANEARSRCASGPAPQIASVQTSVPEPALEQRMGSIHDAAVAGDWAEVGRQAVALQRDLLVLDAQQPVPVRLAALAATVEAKSRAGGKAGSVELRHLSELALASSRFGEAVVYAEKSIAATLSIPNDLLRVDTIMRAWTLIGVARLRQGDTPGAIEALHRSVANPEDPVGHGIGPSMRLAKELLSQGERPEVAQYVSQCAARHWNIGGESLQAWQAEIAKGGTPNFGVNGTF